ncbi:hypothetical protein PENSPDRAFT_728755 [Peniophora sp. CONT]|nr:hypothetical protein PENSPDRAFT_728755 [Peniophora sp. CONT]
MPSPFDVIMQHDASAMGGNQPRTVDDLPEELVAHIFAFATAAPPYYHASQPRAIRLSHVSSRWRMIAIRYQYLWAHVPGNPPNEQWTNVCLSRCVTGDLQFDIPYSVRWDSTSRRQAIRAVLPHITRVGACQLFVAVEDIAPHTADGEGCRLYNDILSALSSGPLPRLRHLEIGFQSNGPWTVPWTRPTLRDNILQRIGDPPLRLTSLKVSGCRMSITSPLYASSLRCLSLRGVQTWSDHDVMESCLQSLPNLERLSFADVLTEPSPILVMNTSRARPIRRIHLPRLWKLYINCALPLALTIYSCIAVPTDSNVHICADAAQSTMSDDMSVYVDIFAEAIACQFGSVPGEAFLYKFVTLSGLQYHKRTIDASNGYFDPNRHRPPGSFSLTSNTLFGTAGSHRSLFEVCMSLRAFHGAAYIQLDHCAAYEYKLFYRKFTQPSRLRLTSVPDVRAFTKIFRLGTSQLVMTSVCCYRCDFGWCPDVFTDLVRVVDTQLSPNAMLELVGCTLPPGLFDRYNILTSCNRLRRLA